MAASCSATAPQGTVTHGRDSYLLAPEGTTSEVTPLSSPKVAPSEVTASEATTTLSPDRNSSCEDCAKIVEAIAEYTCYGLAEIGCALVCFEPGQYVDLGSCEPQCGAVIAAVCAAGVPVNEDAACPPFCAYALALSTVLSSNEYRALDNEQYQAKGNRFDPGQATVLVCPQASFAFVSVSSLVEQRSVAANFLVDLNNETIDRYNHMVFTPNGEKEVAIARYHNGRPRRVYPRIVLGDRYVVTEDGRRWSYAEFIEEQRRQSSQQSDPQRPQAPSATLVSSAQYGDYQQCFNDCYSESYYPRESFCNEATDAYCNVTNKIIATYYKFLPGTNKVQDVCDAAYDEEYCASMERASTFEDCCPKCAAENPDDSAPCEPA